MILSIDNLYKTYGDKILLNDISFTITEQDKIGVIGPNGCGKSTLLKIIAQAEETERGSTTAIGNQQISYLPQNPSLPNDKKIIDYLLENIKKEEQDVATYEASSILNKLELFDHYQNISTLSGGEKRKVALANALVKPSTLLVLDEPTNHLDSDIIEWLEKYLIKTKKAIILVTHDRYFLSRICNKIIDFTKYKTNYGNINIYPGNYNRYLELKANYEQSLATAERKTQSFLKREAAWISRGAQARATKEKKRIERYNDLINREQVKDKKITFESTASRLGKKIIEVFDVAKSYENKILFKDFSLLLDAKSRIGIIGKNGCGKSTLLKVITKEIEPDSGHVEIGETVVIGYFAQENTFHANFDRAIDYINSIATSIPTKKGSISASLMLENFLLEPYTPIIKLSGGELRRLYLVGILMHAPNVLILDEPTNDFDIETLSILENYLDDFNGSVITVSHDRFFLDRVVDELFVYNKSTKQFTPYLGSYSEYLVDKDDIDTTPKTIKQQTPKQTKVRLSYQEQKEFATIEDEMIILDEKISSVKQQIELNYDKYDALKKLYQELTQLETEMEEKFIRWEQLNQINESSKNKTN